MPKSLKIYIFLLVLILIGIIWADATKEKPIEQTTGSALVTITLMESPI